MPDFDYRMAQVSDDQAVAVYPADKAGSGPIVYFETPRTSKRRSRRPARLGGEAGDKAPVPGHGWFAACKDTEGNTFSLWQAAVGSAAS